MWVRHPVEEDDEGQLWCPTCHMHKGDYDASVEKGHEAEEKHTFRAGQTYTFRCVVVELPDGSSRVKYIRTN